MHPHTGELFRPPFGIDLLVEVVGDGLVIEGDMRPGADLLDESNILNQQQVVAGGNAEAADLGVTVITQEQ